MLFFVIFRKRYTLL